MKSLHLIAAARCACAPFTHAESVPAVLRVGDSVAITGDSITQQKSYSVLIEKYLLMCQRADLTQVVEYGWSGEQAAGLLGRVDAEPYPFQPTSSPPPYARMMAITSHSPPNPAMPTVTR
jgi:hypothetical protein